MAAVAALAAVGGCGSAGAPVGTAGDDPTGTSGNDVVVVDPDEELVAHGLLMQSADDRPVEICIGAVAESLPPQCGGPVLVGDFSWDEVDPRRSGGVTWTDDPWWAVGTYDPGTGEQGSLTLTRPVSAEPPEGYVPPPAEDVSFPQLCDDPYVGGDPSASGNLAAQEQLGAAIENLDGYVTSWVSDGSSLYNVVVTTDTDAEAAFSELREVWKGGLCVEQRDLPTQDRLRAAQEALSRTGLELGLLSVGSGGASGLLEVGVVLTDRGTVEAVLETVSEWITPEQVVIRGALQPLVQN